MSILLSNITKHFGKFTALDDINLEIQEGELVALLGPSGCGKTTLLRIIAGLEQADHGRVLFNEKDVTKLHVSRRGIGFVFQHFALFKHMNVFDNIAFGLRIKSRKERPGEVEIAKKVHSLLELVQLGWLAERFPDQLSGGQRQRIALARALAVEPSLLLLDEPFGALDASVRKDLRYWLRNLHQELHVTSIFVTHDQEEAMEIASQVVVLNQGRIEQQGTPDDIYENPVNSFVSRFIGQTNIFNLQQNQSVWLKELGVVPESNKGNFVHVRPHDIDIEKTTQSSQSQLTLKDWQHLGAKIRIELFPHEYHNLTDSIFAEMPNERFQQLNLSLGDRVAVHFKQVHWFD